MRIKLDLIAKIIALISAIISFLSVFVPTTFNNTKFDFFIFWGKALFFEILILFSICLVIGYKRFIKEKVLKNFERYNLSWINFKFSEYSNKAKISIMTLFALVFLYNGYYFSRAKVFYFQNLINKEYKYKKYEELIKISSTDDISNLKKKYTTFLKTFPFSSDVSQIQTKINEIDKRIDYSIIFYNRSKRNNPKMIRITFT